jgi:hypothetical protein
VRGVLLDQLARARRIRLHRRIADALELRAGTNPASLAYHWYEARSARDDDKAIAASMAAGDAAMDQFAFLEAASHFDRALELLEPTADAHAALHCDLLLRAGGARAASGEYARAREAYMQCGRFAQLHSLNDKLVAAGLGLLRPRQSRRAIDPRELTVVEAAYDVCPSDDAATRSQLAARRAALLHEGSDERRRWGAQALALARGSGSDRALRLALSEQAWNMFRADAMDEQLRLTAEVAELARRSGSHEAVLEATTLQFVPAAITGCFDEVDHLREQLEAESLRIGHRYYLALATLGRAAHHAWRGHLDEADRDCAAAIAACQEPELVEAWRGTFFQVRQLGGRLEEIEPVLRGGLRDPDAPMDALWSLARTVTFATVGDIAEAKAEYQVVCPNGVAALSPAGSRIQFLELAWFAEAASLLGDGTCGEQLHRELRPWDGLHCYPSPAVNAGPVSLFLGMLERVMGHHEEAEHHLEDTIVLCDTIGAAAAGGIARTELLLLFEARGTARDAARAEHVRKEIDECVENYGLDGVARRLEVIRASS